MALLLGLLAPLLLSRDAGEARDDGGLSAWSGAHLVFAGALQAARTKGRLLGRTLPFTHCVQLPITSVRGAVLEQCDELMEKVPLPKQKYESMNTVLGHAGLSIAQSILKCAVGPPPPAVPLPWDFASPSKSEKAKEASPKASPKASRGAAAPPGSPDNRRMTRSPSGATPLAESRADHKPQLRYGDVIIAVDGKLITPTLIQTLQLESRHVGATKATTKLGMITVLRAVSSEERALEMIGRGTPTVDSLTRRRESHESLGSGSASSSDRGYLASGSERGLALPPSLASSVADPQSANALSTLKRRMPNTLTGSSAPSSAEPQQSAGEKALDRSMTRSTSIEALRGRLVQDAIERANAEGAVELAKQREAASAQGMQLLQKAEVEAEALRLRKRSQSQAESEAEIRHLLEREKRHELAEIKRAHKEEIERLKAEHGATVEALSAAFAALEADQQSEAAAQLKSFAERVEEWPVPATPTATDSKDGDDEREGPSCSAWSTVSEARQEPPSAAAKLPPFQTSRAACRKRAVHARQRRMCAEHAEPIRAG